MRVGLLGAGRIGFYTRRHSRPEVAERTTNRVRHVHLKDVDRHLAERVGGSASRMLRVERCSGRWVRATRASGGKVTGTGTCSRSSRKKVRGPVTDIRKSLDFLERQLEEVG
jgi:hypothetical protein